ncbi:MAG: 2-oxo acid dehydrogenase subunit E2, partial [Deltaproteobacteria bacterium]|nr:2-oxo acid dehydrogenase subunit E2 [Deltaproteobacteria bacterium]
MRGGSRTLALWRSWCRNRRPASARGVRPSRRAARASDRARRVHALRGQSREQGPSNRGASDRRRQARQLRKVSHGQDHRITNEGDEVEVDDLLAEVETDKATMEFRSFDRGVLLKILVPAGETLEPDVPVAIIGKAGEDISELLAEVAAVSASETESAAVSGAAAVSEAASETAVVSEMGAVPESRSEGRVLSSPLVRRLARERSIDLRTVQGSGPRGRVVKRDIEALPGERDAPALGGERLPPRVVKASSMRRTIARRLTESTQTTPHYYLTIDVDIAPLVDARKAMNAELEAAGKKVSLNDLIIKAAAIALRRVPEVNSSWMGKEIHYHQVVDISVAVAVDEGLMTPVIRDADRKGVMQIAEEVRDLAARARDKKLQL